MYYRYQRKQLGDRMSSQEKTIFELKDLSTYDVEAMDEPLTQIFGGQRVMDMACVPRDFDDAEKVSDIRFV